MFVSPVFWKPIKRTIAHHEDGANNFLVKHGSKLSERCQWVSHKCHWKNRETAYCYKYISPLFSHISCTIYITYLKGSNLNEEEESDDSEEEENNVERPKKILKVWSWKKLKVLCCSLIHSLHTFPVNDLTSFFSLMVNMFVLANSVNILWIISTKQIINKNNNFHSQFSSIYSFLSSAESFFNLTLSLFCYCLSWKLNFYFTVSLFWNAVQEFLSIKSFSRSWFTN